jgi:DNA-directed RNA polymerase specialized sigma24 family protein
MPANRNSLEALVQRDEKFEAVREALSQLNDDYQTILILRFIEGRQCSS